MHWLNVNSGVGFKVMKMAKIEFDLYSIINIKSLKFHFIVIEIDAYKRQDK